ncbi:MAG: YeiH family protein [Candidatus Bathyarchaeia archaeon]
MVKRTSSFLLGYIVLALIAFSGWWLSKTEFSSAYGLEYVLWAIILGLVVRNTVFYRGVPERLQPVFGTYEFWIKMGLVLLGAKLNFWYVISVGARGLIITALCVPFAFFLVQWLGDRYGLPRKFSHVLGAGIAICGVSAAIAAAAAIGAEKKYVTYTIALLLIFGVPLILLYPAIAYAINLPPAVYGAWTGGSMDNTAQVVATGFIYGEDAGKIATIVKFGNNTLIGVVAFLLALFYATRESKAIGKRVSPFVIWRRFPKFILGFVLLSVLATIGLFTEAHVSAMTNLYKWFFALTFAGVGLETGIGEFKGIGKSGLYVMSIATVLLSILAFILGNILF